MNKRQVRAARKVFDGLHDLGFREVVVALGGHTVGRFDNITLETLHEAVYTSKLQGKLGVRIIPMEARDGEAETQGQEAPGDVPAVRGSAGDGVHA